MSARSRKTRSGGAPLFVKALSAVLLAGALFYAGWFGATEAQSYNLFPQLTANASTTGVLGTTADTSNTNANTAAAPEGAAVSVSTAPTDPYAATYTTGSQLMVDGNTINVALSTTTAEIDQGLQDRPTLAPNDGMLFVFDSAKIYQFWMPNMSFSLDMIWIGSDKKVVSITRNAPPLADPSNPVWFRPSVPAQYVLEVNADYASSHNIQVGDAVQFISIPS
jgi:uncharacterized membrane protein (UPF0127 family)